MELVKVNEEYIECSKVSTEVGAINLTVSGGSIGDLTAKFKNATDLQVSGEDKVAYGIYANLTFFSATIDAEETVTVRMIIETKDESRISALEVSQGEQDVAIAKAIYGGDVE